MKPVHFARILIVLFYSILFYYSYQYYNDVELVEIPPKQCEIGYLGGGFRHPTENYTIYYQGKIYDREYKTLGFSNWLWDYNDLMDNQMVQKDPIYFYRLKSEKDLQKTSRYFLPSAKKPDPIYFYRLKSEKDLQKTSRYFLPSAKKPITNKIILALDIWGYFMTNWFWRIFFFILAIAGIMQYFKINEGVERNVFLRINTLSFFFLIFCLAFY
ncbi:hypothetical protein HW49_08890 [Porphyromonadaceae bacterium COT-184 OH4590]|nr:hypothetical protein HW49_08890 [Porphyromonadaceae bacterium COT-184 OH4590]